MFREDAITYVEELFTRTLFKKSFIEFFVSVQQEGIDAARRFWTLYHKSDALIPKAPEIFEKLIDFYIVLGFVPRMRHEKLLAENERLEAENTLLKDTMRELQRTVFSPEGKNGREAWCAILSEQMEMHRAAAKSFLEFLEQPKADNHGQNSLTESEQRGVAEESTEKEFNVRALSGTAY